MDTVIETTKKIIKIALFTPGLKDRWGLPLLFMGQPGIGKSHVIEALTKEIGLGCRTLVASIREPSDFGGLPVPIKQGRQTFVEYAPPMWAADFLTEHDGGGVLFLDEITTCAPAVQAALLRLVLDGALGDFVLSPRVRFLSAANATTDAAGGWDLTPPLANRFGHLDWAVPEIEDYENYLIGMDDGQGVERGVDESHERNAHAEEAMVLGKWPEPFSRHKGSAVGFLKMRRDHLHKMPASGQSARSAAWPSPRSWEYAIRALAGCEVHGAGEIITDDLFKAFVGPGVATEFKRYVKDADLPDPADVLDGRVQFKHNSKRIDRSAAILTGCAALVCSKQCKNLTPRVERLWEIIGSNELADSGAIDVTVPAARALVMNRLSMSSKQGQAALAKLQPILEAANIRPKT